MWLATCNRSSDPTDTFGPCGTWPSGVVHYKFSATANATAIRQAMNDWERMTGNAVRFVDASVFVPPAGTTIETITDKAAPTATAIRVPGARGSGWVRGRSSASLA
jgi:hypothetical protein